jgi:ABC-2 type transport system ATP-binding protein
MRVSDLVRFTRTFYPNWDESYAASLEQTFELDPTQHVGKLSKGQRARLVLLLALAHRPELLVLDEPSSGLDPLVRRDILRAIIRTIADEGRTVLFSSHLLDEVERVADRVAIIERGRIIENDDLESLRAHFHRIVLRFAEGRREPPAQAAGAADGVLEWQGADREWSALFRGRGDDALAFARRVGADVVERSTPSLNEIIMALIGAPPREPLSPA